MDKIHIRISELNKNIGKMLKISTKAYLTNLKSHGYD